MSRDDTDPSSSCLEQILALARRSDSVHVKSEGARVLVNVVRSLCSSSGNTEDPQRQRAIEVVTTTDNADVLSRLLGRSRKHGILLNEAIVAMCLLALKKEGGTSISYVKDLSPLTFEQLPMYWIPSSLISRRRSRHRDRTASMLKPWTRAVARRCRMPLRLRRKWSLRY